jgi:hypothetical protein
VGGVSCQNRQNLGGQDVQAGTGQRRRFEEVGGDDGLGLGTQERCPAPAKSRLLKPNTAYEVELTDDDGATIAMVTLTADPGSSLLTLTTAAEFSA